MNDSPPTNPGAAPDYDRVWTTVYGDMQHRGPVHRHLHRIVRRRLANLTYDSVLDIGCGPANNWSLLCEGRPAPRFAGVDVSPWAVEQARQRYAGDFWVGDIQQTAPDGRWDLVYCSLVLEHLPDDLAALRNMRKVAGRHLLLTTIAGDFERYRAWDERVGHVRNYRPGELEEKVAAAGFTVTDSIYWGFPFYTPLARTLQNYTRTGTGQFGAGARVLAETLYWLYYLNSYRRGDILVVSATV